MELLVELFNGTFNGTFNLKLLSYLILIEFSVKNLVQNFIIFVIGLDSKIFIIL